MMKTTLEKIAIMGLGYVGLPVAVALARNFETVVGFDISRHRVEALQKFDDWTNEISTEELKKSTLKITSDTQDIRNCTFFVVTVPTPIDEERRPDLSPLEGACAIIGPALKKGDVVVFESTVYPGVTEEFCGPLLEKHSGLKQGADFKLGYSPERINPGDKLHRLESITKIISAEDTDTMQRLEHVYGSIIKAGLYKAQNIKVAEAAKVLENTQRDINIALMNELAIIMDLMKIRTRDVLDAAGTKWNFLKFTPGLVGGHCIGVDPYYLTSAAEAHGYHPQVILAGRRVNDDMGRFIAAKTVKLLARAGKNTTGCRVGVLGITFKENVPDIRNSKVPDIVKELEEFGIKPMIFDPIAQPEQVLKEYGLLMSPYSDFNNLDALILAVSHTQFLDNIQNIVARVASNGVIVDIKSAIGPKHIPNSMGYWSL